MSVARVFQEVPVVKSFDRSPASPELIVVMPAYNEQESLRKVVLEWFAELECWTDRFVFLAIDDGSRDDTRRVLERLREQLGPRFELLCHANRGHGQSCLVGYRMACERGIPWVLQIDSDGQCDPQFFHRFWRDRSRYDVIYGYRWRRDDGVRRMIASMVLKATLAFSCRTWCRDANVPYRLMQTHRLLTVLDTIPQEFVLANVALAVQLRRHGWNEGCVPIRFRDRYAGTPSVRLGQFGGKARQLVRQLQALAPVGPQRVVLHETRADHDAPPRRRVA